MWPANMLVDWTGARRQQQVTEGINREASQTLMGSVGTVTHDTTRSHIRSLQPREITEWLKIPSVIKGVATKASAALTPRSQLPATTDTAAS